MEVLDQLLILGQVALAMALSAVVGYERELAHKPAGLRTHMLVAGAAALVVALGLTIVKRFGAGEYPLVRVDPVVVIQAVVTAVGFLGAGTILHAARAGREGEIHVEGLTTAASLLFVAALGTCVALGQTWLALGVTALAWLTLRGVARFEKSIRRKRGEEPPAP